MLIGIVGKPSAGKSTLLNAMCMTDAKMGDFPFTTIKPNRGLAYVTVDCPCNSIDGDCNPRTGMCQNGTRYLPIEMLDVAGLVPGASEGKGMGNQFLDDLRQANLLIHVVDASGTTDEEGNPVDNYNPINDIRWLNAELSKWVYNILFKDWRRTAKKLEADASKLADILNVRLSGLGSNVTLIKKALMQSNMSDPNPFHWNDEDKDNLADILRDLLFPMLIAANKIDRMGAESNFELLNNEYTQYEIIGTSGLAELTLRNLNESNIIKYLPGSSTLEVIDENKGKVALAIKTKLLDIRGSTGVFQILTSAVFNHLNLQAVFPVEDVTHLTDKDGRVLPDAFLVPKGTTAKKFAGKIHSDLADKFINAVVVNKNNKRVSATYEVEHLDVIKIVSAVK